MPSSGHTNSTHLVLGQSYSSVPFFVKSGTRFPHSRKKNVYWLPWKVGFFSLDLKWPYLNHSKKWPLKVRFRNDHDKLVLTSISVDNQHRNKPTAVFWQKVHYIRFFQFTSSDIKKTHFDIRLWSFHYFLDLFLCGFFLCLDLFTFIQTFY